ncbi:hypothetical protein GDO86_012239 [Hymenochirus boettgeri]|uniref:Ig-like domain-containing protein n=1 Tax=Hymenochirus boettgeri TaxID=247094 RepID=A0A8T2IRX9_9PIPI|nr:hypothetical protein GDO86_012239 [Hymenochirus boettgeri]
MGTLQPKRSFWLDDPPGRQARSPTKRKVSIHGTISAVTVPYTHCASQIAPTIVADSQEVQAENVTVVEGGMAEITCQLHQYDGSIVVIQNPVRQTLFFNGTRGITSKQENIKTFSITNSIRIPVDRKDNGEIVTCEASHPALKGQKKQTQYVLDVQFSPTARIQASQSLVREGEALNLKCEVTGNPRPAEIIWTRLNDTFPERAQIQGDVLNFPSLSLQDNGTYSCQVSNKHGRSSDQYVLVVYDPGAIIEAKTQVPYAVIGGILALLVFLVICILIVMVWCSVRQKGSYLTHEASGLDEHGEAREAFLNGGENHKRKEEFFI